MAWRSFVQLDQQQKSGRALTLQSASMDGTRDQDTVLRVPLSRSSVLTSLASGRTPGPSRKRLMKLTVPPGFSQLSQSHGPLTAGYRCDLPGCCLCELWQHCAQCERPLDPAHLLLRLEQYFRSQRSPGVVFRAVFAFCLPCQDAPGHHCLRGLCRRPDAKQKDVDWDRSVCLPLQQAACPGRLVDNLRCTLCR